jgi:hypothetical protein
MPPDHLLLDSTPNLGPLISRCQINKFENCWYRSVRILKVLKLLFQQSLNLSSSQRDMSGPILEYLSNHRWCIWEKTKQRTASTDSLKSRRQIHACTHQWTSTVSRSQFQKRRKGINGQTTFDLKGRTGPSCSLQSKNMDPMSRNQRRELKDCTIDEFWTTTHLKTVGSCHSLQRFQQSTCNRKQEETKYHEVLPNDESRKMGSKS